MDLAPSPYHHGSLAVQHRVGVAEQAAHVGRSIGSGIKPVAAAFLGLQPMLVLGAADAAGRRWASLLTGRPGFLRATGAHSVSIAANVPEHDPLAETLAGGPVAAGAIALDPRTRRRMRMGGTVRPSARGLLVETERVFANCPKYLQKRGLCETGPETPATGAVRRGERLDPDQTAFVRAADTFFVATGTPDGADASHRGGNPGFLHVSSPTELSWQDYPGNAMFLTLGNLERDPHAGLLLFDWTTGTTLQLTGTARTEHTPGGGRTVRFTVSGVVHAEAASPLRWSEPEYSPANPPVRTGAADGLTGRTGS
ncbi:pyridoxamine 5'-phosphate oxidase family protein [Streptomyces sp. ISL-10]|uniref:pyridoxamine 5'-phosphate oxidase family protein n=1 Tax=Streptomyces sp. ISL-10 TaxID=2819172 RepID=UPI001BEA358C|nr:pyridoxamine 5'-phosphate oxidase family protein [Streptomyces sp. ISL-10]MBT2368394.1 pyridoxamine 5'-phosphate oxidase family protein [Streptomyces sp. ISL-10]